MTDDFPVGWLGLVWVGLASFVGALVCPHCPSINLAFDPTQLLVCCRSLAAITRGVFAGVGFWLGLFARGCSQFFFSPAFLWFVLVQQRRASAHLSVRVSIAPSRATFQTTF